MVGVGCGGEGGKRGAGWLLKALEMLGGVAGAALCRTAVSQALGGAGASGWQQSNLHYFQQLKEERERKKKPSWCKKKN